MPLSSSLKTWSKVCRYWGESDRRQGPKIEVPRSLAHYWQRRQHASEGRRYYFDELKKVQIFRFVELCEQYGYREGNTHEMPILIGISVLTMDRYIGWLIWVGVGWFVLGAFLLGYRGEHL